MGRFFPCTTGPGRAQCKFVILNFHFCRKISGAKKRVPILFSCAQSSSMALRTILAAQFIFSPRSLDKWHYKNCMAALFLLSSMRCNYVINYYTSSPFIVTYFCQCCVFSRLSRYGSRNPGQPGILDYLLMDPMQRPPSGKNDTANRNKQISHTRSIWKILHRKRNSTFFY